MNRRDLLCALGAAFFVPRFGRWHRERSGLLVPMSDGLWTVKTLQVSSDGRCVYYTFKVQDFFVADRAEMVTYVGHDGGPNIIDRPLYLCNGDTLTIKSEAQPCPSRKLFS